MTRSRIGLALVAVAIVAAGGALWIGTRRQQTALTTELDRLIRADNAALTAADQPLENVPAPVSRYLRWALRTTTTIQQVRIEQVGTLRTNVLSERWMPFEAEHTVRPPAAGFLWDARVAIAPMLHVRVRDAFINGRGSGQVSLLSAFVVGRDADTPEMNSGSLHRYLAEAVWYPTALLPGPNLRWSEIDEDRALATLTIADVSVSLEFRFAEGGEVTGIYTPARWGTFAEGYRQLPWEGHFRDYRERHGIVVPTRGEVGWYLDDRWRAVWKGRITAFEMSEVTTPAR